jgi:hypothetical protein
MRKLTIPATALLFSLALASPVYATPTSITGTVTQVFVDSTENKNPPETVFFKFQPAAGQQALTTGCPQGSTTTAGTAEFFEFEPASVADAQTRKNMLTLLFAARTAGMTLEVAYDNAGAFCGTSGFAVPINLGL